MPTVSVTKFRGDVAAAINNALRDLGGINRIIGSSEKVLIKPNLVLPRHSNTGATTDLKIVEEIVKRLKDVGAKPIIGEGAGYEFSTEKTFTILGVRRLAKKHGIPLLNLRKEKTVKVTNPKAVIFKELNIPEIITECDAIINVPKLKTHTLTTITCGMKNLLGILPDEERRRAHVFGVEQAIVDLNRLLKPKLTLVDAITAMEGDGPAFGDSVPLGLIIAGDDAVAVDIACCNTVGIDPYKVKCIELAVEQGFDPTKIQVKSERLKKRSLRASSKGWLYRSLYRGMYVSEFLFTKLYREKKMVPWVFKHIGSRPFIERKKCDKCGICAKVCPVNAIDIENATINLDKCIEVRCLMCVESCPRKAITVKGASRPFRQN